MRKRLVCLLVAIVGFILVSHGTLVAGPFYEGKTIRLIVGYSAGGGYDTAARVFSRHLSKHIPGHPTIIVENMPGAGSLIFANHLYRAAKPDGLTIGHFNGALILSQALRQPGIEFDARKFEYIGFLLMDEMVFVMSKVSGFTSIKKWMDSKVSAKIGGMAPGTGSADNAPRIVKVACGLPIQVISGYKGSAEIRLAVESGELDGCCAGWKTDKVTWRKALETGDMVPVLQAHPKPLPDLPNVPLAINLAKTAEARQLIDIVLHGTILTARPLAMPPGTPKEQVQILRNALKETLEDKEFLSDNQRAGLDINTSTVAKIEEGEGMIARMLTLEPALLAKLKEILYK